MARFFGTLLFLASCHGLFVDVPGKSSRCLGEDMSEDALAKFTFYVPHKSGGEATPEEDAKVSGVTVEVDSPKAQLFKKLATNVCHMMLTHEVEVFSFTAEEDGGMHQICVHNDRKNAKRVSLEVETDLSVKDYSDVIKKEHWHPLELQFRMAEDKLKAISAEMDKAREREAEQHVAAEATQARLTLMSSVSIFVLLFVSGWQMQYLKFFFRSKKLL